MTLTDEMIADKYVVMIASLVTTTGFSKQLDGVIATDKYGGHRHYFEGCLNGETKLTTESLAAAIRWYNEQGRRRNEESKTVPS